MKKSFLGISALILLILSAGLVFDAGNADASRQGVRKSSRSSIHPRGNNSVTVSGIVSGSLQGRVRVGNEEILITKNTRLYKSGKGAVKFGKLVVNTPIYAVCERKNDMKYAKLVIISNGQATGAKGEVGIHDPN